MLKKKYRIELTEKERHKLLKTIKCGTSSTRVITRANILLASDATVGEPLTVIEVAERFNTSTTTLDILV